jgi:hypothetical protein
MPNPLTGWSRPSDPIRLVSTNPVHASQVTSIVSTATDILRQELQSLVASGIGQIPATLLPSAVPVPDQLGGGVQPLVDALARLLKIAPAQLLQLITQAPAIQSGQDGNAQSIRILGTSHPVAAGDVTRLLLNLENDDEQADECGIHVTDLIGPSGDRLPASHLRVSPNPARIPAHGAADIRIEVRIPSGTAAGWYTGLLQTDDGESLRALVQVQVGR